VCVGGEVARGGMCGVWYWAYGRLMVARAGRGEEDGGRGEDGDEERMVGEGSWWWGWCVD